MYQGPSPVVGRGDHDRDRGGCEGVGLASLGEAILRVTSGEMGRGDK